MRDLLARKGFPESQAEPCIASLIEWGYLDDHVYARDVLQAVSSGCPVGRRRARFELQKRLVDKELAGSVTDEFYEGVSEEALALEAARKYLNGRNAGSLKEKERERLARWLQRRGFAYESIRSVLSGAGQGDPE